MEHRNNIEVMQIEDNESVQELFSEVLGFFGIGLAISRNETEAIKLIGSMTPDIVVIDMFLPDTKLDGQAILKMLRPRTNFPIIATSSYYTSDSKSGMTKAGFDDSLKKPIDPATLVPYLK